MEKMGTLKERTVTASLPSWQDIAKKGWDEYAEHAFGLARGLGQQLLTKDEWDVHQKVMDSLSGARLDHYRDEVHQEMMEREKQRNVAGH